MSYPYKRGEPLTRLTGGKMRGRKVGEAVRMMGRFTGDFCDCQGWGCMGARECPRGPFGVAGDRFLEIITWSATS